MMAWAHVCTKTDSLLLRDANSSARIEVCTVFVLGAGFSCISFDVCGALAIAIHSRVKADILNINILRCMR